MKSWGIAVVLSIALHLAAVVMLGQVDVPPAPIAVAVPQELRGEVVSFTPVSEPEPAPAPVARVKIAKAMKVAAPEDTGVIALIGVTAEQPEPADAPAHPEPVEGPATTATAIAIATGPMRVAGPAAELIELVHGRLASMADRCYPAAARRFQQRGTVKVSFCTDAKGGASRAVVTESSGAELLDAAARGCVIEQAAPFPPEASSLCFSVPVRFGASNGR